MKVDGIMTKFILYKGRMSTTTTNIFVVKQLKLLGWKVKHNKLSDLI